MSEVQMAYKIVDKKRKPAQKAKGTLTKVKEMKASEVYRAKATDPEAELFAIYCLVEGRELRVANFNKPKDNEISSKSKLAQFKHRYKRFPTPGMKVDLVTNDKGYWTLVL